MTWREWEFQHLTGTIPDGFGFDENSVAGVHGSALNYPGDYYFTVDMTDAAALPGCWRQFYRFSLAENQ